ncbi:metal-dependent hydrolase family protein [Streptomonospora wellingtoniae]|uniref:Amidohydrolase family protein n=1 Tax=Streptomonospora wellingtoniae TaxID=3075544 RepID=A0ABU2KT40_9ACTN|nr:amidohydrolase family protein [Streptomonospora sp. DSM 45055]MDT0302466.1 amidohydrolase family protein [Streptomonospora sp. DSM 45055]
MSGPSSCPVILIRDVRIFNGVDRELRHGHVLLKDRRIDRVFLAPEEPPSGIEATVIDGRRADGTSRALMPGLIDAHAHVMLAGSTQAQLLLGGAGLAYYNGLAEARAMLLRGFTAVRDMSGDTVDLKRVLDAGVFPGPRIYPCQAGISQTSGHADFGAAYEPPTALGGASSRAEQLGMSRIADGRARVLAAVREQLKKGASQIKVMAGGGVASAYDPLEVSEYTPDELRAAVEAAEDWGTYVSVHVYAPAGIERAVEAGVKSIEHGHLAEESTIALLAQRGTWLSTQPFVESDHSYENPASAEKNRRVCAGVEQTYRWARQYGVKTAFGTDLLLNPSESRMQARMLPRLTGFGYTAAEALTMATSGNAALLALAGDRDPYRLEGCAPALGRIVEGAWADVLVVDGDPTRNLDLLADPETNLAVIIKDGHIHKNLIGA